MLSESYLHLKRHECREFVLIPINSQKITNKDHYIEISPSIYPFVRYVLAAKTPEKTHSTLQNSVFTFY